ncbi:MAG TPA: hypothetical protein PLO23_03290 [Alphaproteobacteria bacterium]|nr:hypothetical protein [Alphaproteobacteria bacterium]
MGAGDWDTTTQTTEEKKQQEIEVRKKIEEFTGSRLAYEDGADEDALRNHVYQRLIKEMYDAQQKAEMDKFSDKLDALLDPTNLEYLKLTDNDNDRGTGITTDNFEKGFKLNPYDYDTTENESKSMLDGVLNSIRMQYYKFDPGAKPGPMEEKPGLTDEEKNNKQELEGWFGVPHLSGPGAGIQSPVKTMEYHVGTVPAADVPKSQF